MYRVLGVRQVRSVISRPDGWTRAVQRRVEVKTQRDLTPRVMEEDATVGESGKRAYGSAGKRVLLINGRIWQHHTAKPCLSRGTTSSNKSNLTWVTRRPRAFKRFARSSVSRLKLK